MSPEEMFYLATGLVDVHSWTSLPANHHPRTGRRLGACHCQAATSSATPSSATPSSATPSSAATSRVKESCPVSSSLSSSSCPTSSSWTSSSWSSSWSRSSSTSSSPSSSPSSSASFSSRSRRCHWPTTAVLTLILLLTFSLRLAEGCSSRSTPKPRPPPPPPSAASAVRPNITFQTYSCPPTYATYYCLNGATCFTIKIGESILYNCECTEGYMGQRCEYKDLEGSYLPLREKILLERASIAGGATVAVILVVILSIIFYSYVRQRRKELRLSSTVEVTSDKLERRINSCRVNNSISSISNSSILLYQYASQHQQHQKAVDAARHHAFDLTQIKTETPPPSPPPSNQLLAN